MNLPEALAEFESSGNGFPGEAVEWALAERGQVTVALLEILRRTIDNAEELAEDETYMAHFYAMYILAQFREKRAYPLIVELFRLPSETIDGLTGDLVATDLHQVLASVSRGDDSLIKSLIEDSNVDVWVRDASLRALVTLAACGDKQREEVLDYFRSLFRTVLPREPSFLWSSLCSCATDLYPEDLLQDIEQCYDEGLADEIYIALDEVRHVVHLGKEATLEDLSQNSEYRLMTDAIEALAQWPFFQVDSSEEDDESAFVPSLRPEPEWTPPPDEWSTSEKKVKIGRNAPCPCGSGKKYKKCCGRL